MTSRSRAVCCRCVSFAGVCLWVMLTMREIQGYPSYRERRAFWNSLYNKRIKPVNDVAQFSNYYPRLPYPYRFSGRPVPIFSNIQWQPFPIFNPRLRKNGEPVFNNGRWVNSGNWINNGFAGTSNLRTVPPIVFPTMFQQTTSTTRRGQEEDRGDVLWTEAAVYEETTTQTRRKEENPRVEGSTIESAAAVLSCEGNCDDGDAPDEDDVSRLIKKALRNGELLSSDEWIRQRNMTKKHRGGGSGSTELWDNPFDSSDPSNSAPVCVNSTFCLHATHYPEELVNQAIRRNDGLKLLESVDQVSEVGDRVEFDEPNDSPFCRSYVRLIYPRSAEAMGRRWLYVVNQNNLRQGVRIEICAKEGSACGDLDDYLPGGYRAFCKQKYVYRELVAVDADGAIKKDTFKFPSSCCCHREFVGFRDPTK